MMTRDAAEIAIDRIREPLLDTPHYNALAGVVRNLYDGHPLADAHSSLEAASYSLPTAVTYAVRTILNDTQEN